MGIKKTLGGDRLGSGNRQKQEMHNFERSNKNLSTTIATTMAPGVLYPVYTNIALKGDTFDIDASAFVRTIPTIGPLYGSFKLQVDLFQIPFRLYQAILHNNTTDIARKMNQVLLPKVELTAKVNQFEIANGFKDQINTSALMRYINNAGVGVPESLQDFVIGNSSVQDVTIKNKRLAIPMLAYYDIFKNYYSNKQEENAYVITPLIEPTNMTISSVIAKAVKDSTETPISVYNESYLYDDIYSFNGGIENAYINKITIKGSNLETNKIYLKLGTNGTTQLSNTIQFLKDAGKIIVTETSTQIDVNLDTTWFKNKFNELDISAKKQFDVTRIHLQEFPLSNIDDMRKYLLTQWDLGTRAEISETNQNYYPYLANTQVLANGESAIKYPLNGLVVKTYQSDWFNNWLDTEWVNEITTNSAIDVTNGSFTLDMLNFKKKLYDHLNRLAISGGTYDDWQEATYGDKVWGKSEKPIYCGGLSSEVEFDEVVSTAQSGEDVLGTLAGRGKLNGRKGGKITIKVGEASVIMAIASLTPRIMYTQGNAWYNTELDSMDDLHKPIFDRIGFQDLMVEQMAWWDRKYKRFVDGNFHFEVPAIRTSAGKQPAWIQYATDVDKAYGDFAKKEGGINYMILSRNYEQDNEGNVADVTTYIDPQKYNYAFAYQELDAQNFWTFIRLNIKARRKMSNTQIPNV